MTMRRFALHLLLPLALFAIAVAAAVTFGGPRSVAPLASMEDPFRAVDDSALPPVQRFVAPDGMSLAYRAYESPPAASRGSVVLIHGTTADSRSMHRLAQRLAGSGRRVYSLDMRGHGASGPRGHVAYQGQMEDDLTAFLQAVNPPAPRVLLGFSAGGGFALRYAGTDRQDLFDGYALLSPFLSQDAPTHRDRGGGWVSVGVPRIIGLTILNHVGVHAFDHLPVTRFALSPRAMQELTPSYSFNLAMNFRPHADYEANIRAVRRPVTVVAGDADEAFRTDQLEPTLRALGRDWLVRLLPGIGHVGLILDDVALAAVLAALDGLLPAS